MKIGTVESQNNFETILRRCNELKEKEKIIKSETKKLVDAVKTKFESLGLNEYNIPGEFCVKCSKVEKTSMNEDKLIGILNNLSKLETDDRLAESVKSCIEYKPTINEKKVQQLIYQGIINVEDIAPAMETTTQTRLTFGKPKKEVQDV